RLGRAGLGRAGCRRPGPRRLGPRRRSRVASVPPRGRAALPRRRRGRALAGPPGARPAHAAAAGAARAGRRRGAGAPGHGQPARPADPRPGPGDAAGRARREPSARRQARLAGPGGADRRAVPLPGRARLRRPGARRGDLRALRRHRGALRRPVQRRLAWASRCPGQRAARRPGQGAARLRILARLGRPDAGLRPGCRDGRDPVRLPRAGGVSWSAHLLESPDKLRRAPGRRPPVIGMVLAAGAGRRLRPDTDNLPKALLPVAGELTILDIALQNLASVGLTDIAVVVGYAAAAIAARQPDLEKSHGVTL